MSTHKALLAACLHIEGGHLRPSVYARLSRYIKEFGVEAAVEVADFEFDHIQAIADVVKKEKVECEFNLARSLYVQCPSSCGEFSRRLSFEDLSPKR